MAFRPLACALSVLVALSGCSRRDDSNAVTGAPAAVTVQQATLQTLRDTLTIPGIVVPAAAADLLVYAPEAARIVELPKAEGEKFESGDLLARFDITTITAEVETRERELSDATTRAAAAKAEEARLGALHGRGLIARNAYDASKTALITSEAALQQARTQMESAKLLQERTTVRARFAGLVLKRWHAEGDLVAGGSQDPVLRAVDPTRIQVAIEVTPLQLSRLVYGQAAQIQTGLGPPEPATVVVRPAALDGGPPKIEVRLAPIAPVTLPLDSPVQVEIVLDERPQVVVVPTGAVLKDDQLTYVLVAGTDNRAHRRDVRVGLQTRGLTHIVSGVNVGDLVIVGGLDTIADGSAISVSR